MRLHVYVYTVPVQWLQSTPVYPSLHSHTPSDMLHCPWTHAGTQSVYRQIAINYGMCTLQYPTQIYSLYRTGRGKYGTVFLASNDQGRHPHTIKQLINVPFTRALHQVLCSRVYIN